jgi:hypothetical protein
MTFRNFSKALTNRCVFWKKKSGKSGDRCGHLPVIQWVIQKVIQESTPEAMQEPVQEVIPGANEIADISELMKEIRNMAKDATGIRELPKEPHTTEKSRARVAALKMKAGG